MLTACLFLETTSVLKEVEWSTTTHTFPFVYFSTSFSTTLFPAPLLMFLKSQTKNIKMCQP